ncbi:phage repressor protein [Candidatus Pantoea multigeneris]|uniref:Phage repressor protein n=1 Tax=Candidatus Pantoea multigeneris TaxID=2608357 RepID=A0ABX0RAQ9_9GAMM|nr:phage repressor protein [Pantoea multigeneris]NIF20564.1 phage repressor protein [Pantoea multigeneris]
MGFPSPASDYIESRIDLNKICMPHPDATFRIDTSTGFVLADCVARIEVGDRVAFQHLGYPMIGKYYPKSLVTEDGEAIEGEALEEVVVLGKIVCEILTLEQNEGPV